MVSKTVSLQFNHFKHTFSITAAEYVYHASVAAPSPYLAMSIVGRHDTKHYNFVECRCPQCRGAN